MYSGTADEEWTNVSIIITMRKEKILSFSFKIEDVKKCGNGKIGNRENLEEKFYKNHLVTVNIFSSK